MFNDSLTFNQKTKVLIACSLIAFISLLILVDLVIGSKKPAGKEPGQESVVISKADRNEKPNDAKTIEDLIREIEEGVVVEKGATKDREHIVAVDPKSSSTVSDSAVQPSAESGAYTVREGDSYWVIAKKTLGKGSRWEEISRLNPDIKPGKLRKGLVIKIPSKGAAENNNNIRKGATNIDNNVKQDRNKYTVKKGDSLWKIAQMVSAGNTLEDKMKMLLRENKGKFVKGDYIVPGVTITIP